MEKMILETKTITAVGQVLDGNRVEDDLLELKGTWPDPNHFARQLAGIANRAAGHELVVIIGIDEKSHQLTDRGDIDIQEWWPKLQSRFDENTAPELVLNITISLPDGGSVVALAFASDRAPYVVNSEDGKPPHKEIPMRSGTGTRSARRSEILQLLAPRVNIPNIRPLSASVRFRESHNFETREVTAVRATIETYSFIEHLRSAFIMFPLHAMGMTLKLGEEVHRVKIDWQVKSESFSQPHSVSRRNDGLLATGPGIAWIPGTGVLSPATRKLFDEEVSAEISVTLQAVGSPLPIRFDFFVQAQSGDYSREDQRGNWSATLNSNSSLKDLWTF